VTGHPPDPLSADEIRQLKPVGFFDRNPALDVPPTDCACDGD
jgi:Cu2+-containing amine oxidase